MKKYELIRTVVALNMSDDVTRISIGRNYIRRLIKVTSEGDPLSAVMPQTRMLRE
jgi:hypothetical protein